MVFFRFRGSPGDPFARPCRPPLCPDIGPTGVYGRRCGSVCAKRSKENLLLTRVSIGSVPHRSSHKNSMRALAMPVGTKEVRRRTCQGGTSRRQFSDIKYFGILARQNPVFGGQNFLNRKNVEIRTPRFGLETGPKNPTYFHECQHGAILEKCVGEIPYANPNESNNSPGP